jgi:glycerol kinase
MLGVAGVAAAPLEEFVAACGVSGKTSPQSCRCQAKLAQSSFTAKEMQVAIIGVKGDQAAFRTALQAMTKGRAKAFLDKMRALAGKVSSECS